mmetsp:Transcript_18989/g.32443  ORF Transcript_18989/g.32443 Transcript_18989/m.32443 type:complete len:99 (-) Transcript_18989:97-393(-)
MPPEGAKRPGRKPGPNSKSKEKRLKKLTLKQRIKKIKEAYYNPNLEQYVKDMANLHIAKYQNSQFNMNNSLFELKIQPAAPPRKNQATPSQVQPGQQT